ncbi:proline dehydrogenase family protein [Roseateles chitinivorans]|uniref:proline dehydrogenase family protein n=1 Tax=Roseateles chitinivorans TaxID=2917965 RepID=UPI003D667083
MSLFDSAVSHGIGLLPRPLVQRMAARYVAGPRVADAIALSHRLISDGFPVTLDVLGESARDLADVEAAERAYLALLDELAVGHLAADISLKPTALGLLLDPSHCEASIGRIAARARALGLTVCMDMEDSRCTQLEIDMFLRLRAAGAPASLALQAYLLRTAEDTPALAQAGHPLRICKGIYSEPEALLVPGAADDRRRINAPFLDAVRACFEADVFVSIATHDEALIDAVLALAGRHAVDNARFELQMLLGVCEPLRESLRDRGVTVRVYVPFGADWYAYCVRRLKENPRLAGQIARSIFRR